MQLGRPDDPGVRRINRLRIAALGVVACVVIAANAVVFHQIDRQLDQSYTAEADSTVWNATQVEIELLRFANALAQVMLTPDAPEQLDALRLQYDLLYSRAQMISRQDRLLDLPLAQGADWEAVGGPEGIVARALPLIDGPDEALVAAVPVLLQEVRVAISNLRDDVVASAISSIRETESQRRDLHEALQVFSAVSLGLMGVMAGLLIVIFLQGRARETHRKALAQAVYNLRITIDSSLEAAVILDHEGRIVGCNKAGADMFGIDDGAFAQRHFSDVVRDARRGAEGIAELTAACAASDGQGRIVLTGTRPDGSTFPLELSLAQAESAAGLPISIAFLRDISERVEREETLRRARNAALEAEEAKSRFLAMIGHEMRTPLNGLLSAVEVLKAATALTDKQASLLRIIENSGRKTLEQVNNVLDLTLLQHGDGADLPEIAFSLSEVVQGVISTFEAEARQRGNQIGVRITGQEPARVIGSEALVARILSNLVSNAVKFTENGTISIGIDCQPGQAAQTVALRLSVMDTGVGIDEADRDRIFKVFETLDSSYARLREGSGLGLGLAKLAAEAMGGRITVSSRPGEGSTFALYLNLPVASEAELPLRSAAVAAGAGEAQARADQPVAETPVALRALTLLVVEDNPVNRELLAEVLRLKGHHVLEASNGAEGVTMAEANRPDAILMDISMPVMDGVEASRAIRAGQASRDVPIIAVTANADMSRHSEFRAAGINEVLNKPVDFARLEQVLRAHLRDKASADKDLPAEIPVPAAPAGATAVLQHAANGTAHAAMALVQNGAHPDGGGDPFDKAGEEDGWEEAGAEQDGGEQDGGEQDGGPVILDEEVYTDLFEALGSSYMQRMANKLSAETEETLRSLVTFEAAGDLEEAAKIAHRSAGAVAAMGLRALHHALVTYEQQAKAGESDAAIATRGQISRVSAQTFDALRERGILV